MHTFSENSAGVPAFLAKLWRLVEDEETNNLIDWSAVSWKLKNKKIVFSKLQNSSSRSKIKLTTNAHNIGIVESNNLLLFIVCVLYVLCWMLNSWCVPCNKIDEKTLVQSDDDVDYFSLLLLLIIRIICPMRSLTTKLKMNFSFLLCMFGKPH